MACDILWLSLTCSHWVLRIWLVASAHPGDIFYELARFLAPARPCSIQKQVEISPKTVRTLSLNNNCIYATKTGSQEFHGFIPIRLGGQRIHCRSCSTAHHLRFAHPFHARSHSCSSALLMGVQMKKPSEEGFFIPTEIEFGCGGRI